MKKSALFVVLLLAIVGAVAPFYLQSPDTQGWTQLKRFSSYEELKSFLKASSQVRPYYDKESLVNPMRSGALEAAPSYSTTNVQVEGVDETDTVKTDGEYIYVVSGNNVTIVRAYPPEGAAVLSTIGLNGTVVGIFINGDRLVVFDQPNPYILVRPLAGEASHGTFRTSIRVYAVSDRRSPILRREVALDGWYFNSRMIGDYVYAVIHQPVIRASSEGEDKVILPKVYVDGWVREIPASEIYYSDVADYSYTFTTMVALNVQNDREEPTHKTILMGATSSMYVSRDNIYIAIPKWTTSEVKTLGSLIDDVARRVRTLQVEGESTVIYRIHVEGSKIESKASGEVPGRVLNQFSMDEYKGHFRIATTTGQVWSSQAPSRNHVYVLSMNLSIVGRLEDLAPGETIYSARFMGERCYLVTFRKVDPLFVIDLKDSTNPRVLGQLKITGYSDYLHPYDETHVIGIGKETVAAEEGNFAWYQGVKISLFDVSNVSKPKEIAKYEIGDRGTDSPILRDHHALLFDRSKNLLVLPVLVAKIDPKKYPNGVPPYAYGDYVWQGAYVFHISQNGELMLKGRITHLENSTDLMKSGYYFYSSYSVKRSLYIGNVLYTISDKKIKMNSLSSLGEINKVDLS